MSRTIPAGQFAAARAATAATVTLTAAVTLFAVALGLYHWAGGSSDLIMRDAILATLLGLFSVGNLVAPLRAGRSAAGVLVVGALLLVLSVLGVGVHDGMARVRWCEIAVGATAVVCALTTLSETWVAGRRGND
jgi:hypothetical protein